MKNYLLFLLTVLFPAALFSQTYSVEYMYDYAGNRVSRKVITLKSPVVRAAASTEEIAPLQEKRGKCLFTISPNPTKGLLGIHISNGEEEDLHRIEVYTSAGSLLRKTEYSGNGSTDVNLSAEPSGVYFLIITTGNERAEYKIIKQ